MGSNGNRPACSACRHQKKKCREDCVLAPYFPTNKTQEYEAVHKVFGYSNISKMLTNLDQQERKEAIKSFEWEAMMWNQDPVYGPLGAYNNACNIITQLMNLINQQKVQTFEPHSMTLTLTQQDSSLFTNEALAVSNNDAVNWAPFVANNNVVHNNSVYQEINSVTYPYVEDSFRGGLQNEDTKLLNFVPASNDLYSPLLLQQKSSMSQPNFLESFTSDAGNETFSPFS